MEKREETRESKHRKKNEREEGEEKGGTKRDEQEERGKAGGERRHDQLVNITEVSRGKERGEERLRKDSTREGGEGD
jgi:hypothetical protein